MFIKMLTAKAYVNFIIFKIL